MNELSRSEFPPEIKRIIAGRAGYRCSFPKCGRVTIGPGAKSNQTESAGVAAHIFPASSGGPRNASGLTESQRKAPENGIWLCSTHARLVDENDGEKYPPVILQSYKALHEANIAREQGGVYSPAGWFHELTVHESPVFKPKTKLRFGKVTLVVGENSSGKTILCDWLACINEPSILAFRTQPKTRLRLNLELAYSNPVEQSARLEIGDDGEVKHFLQGKEFPFHPSPLRFVFVREPYRSELNATKPDDFQLICSQLNVDPVTVRNLFRHVNKFGSGSINDLRTEDRQGTSRVIADFGANSLPGLSYAEISHSQQTRILIELAITVARISGEHVPTMLTLEGFWRLDESWFNFYCEYLSEANRLFQTIIVLPEVRSNVSRLRWSGWVVARLKRNGNGTVINQESL
ncbi:MAG: hypothetical protein QOJ40_1374 [Verrucomicrobiota bacterium]